MSLQWFDVIPQQEVYFFNCLLHDCLFYIGPWGSSWLGHSLSAWINLESVEFVNSLHPDSRKSSRVININKTTVCLIRKKSDRCAAGTYRRLRSLFILRPDVLHTNASCKATKRSVTLKSDVFRRLGNKKREQIQPSSTCAHWIREE